MADTKEKKEKTTQEREWEEKDRREGGRRKKGKSDVATERRGRENRSGVGETEMKRD